MEIGLIIGVILFYFYTVTCAFLAVQIAAAKGRRRRWGWLGVFFGVIGLVVVCFLPNAKGVKGDTNPLRNAFKKISGISPVAVWIVVAGIVVVVGGALLGTRLTSYIENRSHEKELVQEDGEEPLLKPETVYGKVKDVFCGEDAQFALTEEADLYGWGRVDLEPDETGVLYQKVQKICTTGKTIYLLTTDGTLYAKGDNTNSLVPGQKNAEDFTKIDEDVKDIALSQSVGAFIKENGNLYVCGINTYGQLGTEEARIDHTGHRLAEKVAKVVATNRSLYYMLEDGTVFALGNNSFGQFGLGHKDSSGVAVKIAEKCKDIAAGADFTLLLMKDGSVLTAGNNAFGQLGRETTEEREEALDAVETVTEEEKKEETEENKTVSAMKFGKVELEDEVDKIAASNHTAYILVGEELFGWGQNHCGQIGGNDLRVASPKSIHTTVADMAAGDETLVIVTQGGKLYSTASGSLKEMAKIEEGKK